MLDLVMSHHQRLFAVDVLPGIECIEHGLRMEIEWRGNEDGIDLRVVQDASIVIDRLRFLSDKGARPFQLEWQDVADRPDIESGQPVGQSQQFTSLPAGPDMAGPQHLAAIRAGLCRNQAGDRRQRR